MIDPPAMPLPTITDCYRVAIDWKHLVGGFTATNVIHVLAPLGDEDEVAEAVAVACNPNMWDTVTSSGEIDQLVVTKLDGTPDGRVYGRTALEGWNPTANALKGTAGGHTIVQVGALVKLATGATGRSGRGRVYLPWIGEAAQNSGFVETADKDLTTDGWVTFANDLVTNNMALCVASYKNSTAAQVLNLACEDKVATQRKRLRR